jgi:broad specificity phosphatase PhoE
MKPIASRVTLICHAATSAVRAADFPMDEPLDPAGRQAAAALAPSLGRPDRAWTSPALRSRQTAQALNLDAVAETALRPCDYGRWAGLSLADVQARDGETALLTWLSDPMAAPHGGEAIVDVLDRVGKWLDGHALDGGHTVVVSHAEVIKVAILHAIKAPPAAFARIDVGPLSRVALSHNQGWRLRALAPISGIR